MLKNKYSKYSCDELKATLWELNKNNSDTRQAIQKEMAVKGCFDKSVVQKILSPKLKESADKEYGDYGY